MGKRKESSQLWLYITLAIFIIFTISLLIVGRDSLRHCEGAKQSQTFTPYAPEFISTKYYPPVLKSLIVNPGSQTNYFDFILDSGSGELASAKDLKPVAKELIKYFFLGLTLPSEEFWVNLNPVQPDNITGSYLSQTDVGRILLAADLKLKQDASQLTDPRTELGAVYWEKLNQKLRQANLPTEQIPTGTRLWIIPGKIALEEQEDNAVTIVSAKLKVCLESEYLNNDSPPTQIQEINAQVFKEVILPTIEHEVNYGEAYAKLRQVYNSLILAARFKQKYWAREKSIYSSLVNRCYLEGLHSRQSWNRQHFFQAYLSSFDNGEYSFYRQEYDPQILNAVNRHYFYGGIDMGELDTQFAGSPSRQEESFLTSSLQIGYSGTLWQVAAISEQPEAWQHRFNIAKLSQAGLPLVLGERNERPLDLEESGISVPVDKGRGGVDLGMKSSGSAGSPMVQGKEDGRGTKDEGRGTIDEMGGIDLRAMQFESSAK